MDINELMQKVEQVSKNYADEFGFKRDNDWFIFKMQEEIGELIQIYLMMTGRGRSKGLTDEEMRKKFEIEIADLFCSVLLFANHYDVDIMKAIDEKWFKRLKPE